MEKKSGRSSLFDANGGPRHWLGFEIRYNLFSVHLIPETQKKVIRAQAVIFFITPDIPDVLHWCYYTVISQQGIWNVLFGKKITAWPGREPENSGSEHMLYPTAPHELVRILIQKVLFKLFVSTTV